MENPAQLEGDNMTMFDDNVEQADATNAVKRKKKGGAGRAAKVKKTENGSQEQEATEDTVNGDSNGVESTENGEEQTEETVEEETEKEAEAEVDEPLVVEELFSVFVSSRRRNFRLPDEVVQEIKNEFASSGVNIIDTFSTNNYNFYVRVSKAKEAEKLIKKFNKKVVAGLELFVKDKLPRPGQYQVRVKSTNDNVCFDYEFADEISEELKQMEVDFHNCKAVKKEVEINLFHKEDLKKVVEKFNCVNFGHVDIVAEVVDEDSKSQASGGEGDPNESTASEDNTSEPFVFAAMKSNKDVFNTKNLKILAKAFQEESIEVTRSNTASGGKFAYFFVKTWEDADKFLGKYSSKVINGMLIGFEKGSNRNYSFQHNYEQNKNSRPNSGAPRGGQSGNRGGGGNWQNRNAGGGGYGGNRGGSYGGPPMWGGQRGGGYGYPPHFDNRGAYGGAQRGYYRGGW